jgi:hypothetical protein
LLFSINNVQIKVRKLQQINKNNDSSRYHVNCDHAQQQWMRPIWQIFSRCNNSHAISLEKSVS